MLKKFIILLSIVVVIFVGNLIHNYNTYFFTPNTFEKDHITHLPYEAYKKTMGYSLYDYRKQQGDLEIITNNNEIKLIYSELKKGEILGNSVDNRINNQFKLVKPTGRVTIYSDIDNKEGKAISSTIYWYGEDYEYVKASGVFEVNGEQMVEYLFIKMTPKIKEFFSSKFNLD